MTISIVNNCYAHTVIDVPENWAGGIDDLVEEANRWLSTLLPADRAQRPKDEVNPRLVRHYTTQGLLPAALREGREARYTREHLLALLALRRLMADGLSGKALYAALHEKIVEDLESLAVQGSGSVQGLALEEAGEVQKDDALSYLQRLKGQRGSEKKSSPKLELPDFLISEPEVLPSITGKLPSKRRGPQQVFRVVLRPGLEILVGDQFRYPRTEDEWGRLYDEFRTSLSDVQSS